jgi:hypothetical protein
MKKIDLGQPVQLFANLAVLAGIIVLAFELRELTLATRLNAAENYTDRENGIERLLIENPDLLTTNIKSRSGQPLDDIELQQVLAYNRLRLRSWQAAFNQHQNSGLSEQFFEVLKQMSRVNCSLIRG